MTIKFFIPPHFCPHSSPSTAFPWLFFVHFTVFQHLLQHLDRVAGLCPNFLAPAVSACIRAGDLRSLFAPRSGRNCCVSTGLHFAPGQSSYRFHNCCDGVSKRQECSPIGTRSYIQLERLIGLRVSGHMTLRALKHSRRHDGKEPRHNLRLAHILSMALGILRTLQVVLNRSSFLLRLTLLSCSGIGTAIF